MLDKTYLAGRAALIGDRDLGTVSPGVPPGAVEPAAPDRTTNTTGTSHISVVDRYGNALAMTTSIESSFGNGVMVPGRGFCSTTSSPIFPSRRAVMTVRRSPIAWKPTSGRAVPWPRRWCSTRAAAWSG